MPTWVKYAIVFGIGVAVGKSPGLVLSAAHGIDQFLAGLGHG